MPGQVWIGLRLPHLCHRISSFQTCAASCRIISQEVFTDLAIATAIITFTFARSRATFPILQLSILLCQAFSGHTCHATCGGVCKCPNAVLAVAGTLRVGHFFTTSLQGDQCQGQRWSKQHTAHGKAQCRSGWKELFSRAKDCWHETPCLIWQLYWLNYIWLYWHSLFQ